LYIVEYEYGWLEEEVAGRSV